MLIQLVIYPYIIMDSIINKEEFGLLQSYSILLRKQNERCINFLNVNLD